MDIQKLLGGLLHGGLRIEKNRKIKNSQKWFRVGPCADTWLKIPLQRLQIKSGIGSTGTGVCRL